MGNCFRLLAACLSSAALLLDPAHAQSRAFTQLGTWSDTESGVIGLIWDWSRQHDIAGGLLTGYWEVSLGHWSTEGVDGRDTARVTQLGATPVLRHLRTSGLFVEGGIGANVVSPRYRNNHERFSTRFNFGDHVALGYRFGQRQRHEVALRFQHFSNAGIRQPNPGQDFVQLRYAFGLQ